MESLAKGDIVLFPFPFTDLSNSKLRPALVISDEMGQDIMLAQITSKNIEGDMFSVMVKEGDTLDGTLTIDSHIRCNMIFTACRSLIVKRICSLKPGVYGMVVKKVSDIIR